MYDPDQEMMDYIDEVIVGDRTSDAAEDSAGAAWAAYERGEFSVPEWYSREYRRRHIKYYKVKSAIGSGWKKLTDTGDITFAKFLQFLGGLTLAVLVFLIIWMIIEYLFLG